MGLDSNEQTLGEGLTLKGEEEGERSVVVPSPDHCRPVSALQSIATTPEG